MAFNFTVPDGVEIDHDELYALITSMYLVGVPDLKTEDNVERFKQRMAEYYAVTPSDDRVNKYNSYAAAADKYAGLHTNVSNKSQTAWNGTLMSIVREYAKGVRAVAD